MVKMDVLREKNAKKKEEEQTQEQPNVFRRTVSRIRNLFGR